MQDLASALSIIIPAAARGPWAALSGALFNAEQVPCERDPDRWWPQGRGVPPDYGPAIAGCRSCPAREPCLRYAVAAGEKGGVWGGTSPDERRQLAADAAA